MSSIVIAGQLILEQVQDLNATHLFSSYHALSDPVIMKKYASMVSYNDTIIEKRVYKRIKNYFSSKNLSQKAPWWMVIWYMLWTILMWTSFVSWLIFGSYAFLFGISIFYCAGDSLHSGTHYSIFKNVKLNVMFSYINGMFFHIPSAWIRQHVLSHHIHTNDLKDVDLYHFEFLHHIPMVNKFYPTWKLGWITSRLQESYYNNPLLRLMVFILAIMMTNIGPLLVQTPWLLVTSQYMGHNTSPLSRIECFIAWVQYFFVTSSICYCILQHGIMIAFLPFSISGIIFHFLSQVSHINEESQGHENIDWICKQVRASRGDYRYNSRLWNLLSIGLNLQSVHHVLPTVHWSHYPNLYKIVWEECENIERVDRSFFQAIYDYFYVSHRSKSYKKRRKDT